jgi:hypothetical protein
MSTGNNDVISNGDPLNSRAERIFPAFSRERTVMKYGDVNLGQVEALINIVGGEDGMNDLLSNRHLTVSIEGLARHELVFTPVQIHALFELVRLTVENVSDVNVTLPRQPAQHHRNATYQLRMWKGSGWGHMAQGHVDSGTAKKGTRLLLEVWSTDRELLRKLADKFADNFNKDLNEVVRQGEHFETWT